MHFLYAAPKIKNNAHSYKEYKAVLLSSCSYFFRLLVCFYTTVWLATSVIRGFFSVLPKETKHSDLNLNILLLIAGYTEGERWQPLLPLRQRAINMVEREMCGPRDLCGYLRC